MTEQNLALWRRRRRGPFQIGPAPYTHPGPGEIVVRARAIAVNPVDDIPGPAYLLVLPWLRFPAVVGGDVAGEVVETGPGVTRLRAGDRVVGHALGLERSRNSAAEGAFQRYVVLMQHMVSPIPDTLSFARAAVLPLALSTAATGLFQRDQLALALPTGDPADRGATVLVWGGSTSVGSNAIQLARNAGYRVVSTASPRNFDYLRSLGAAEVVDRTSPSAVDAVVDRIGGQHLAGTLAIGSGALRAAMAIADRTQGSKRIAAAQPQSLTRIQAWRAPKRGLRVSGIWGGTLKDNEVGPAIYVDFLPAALASGDYRAAPDATVVGDGLERIPEALRRLRAGVSAAKLVVTL
jgi:NADPH:quinone reductase-like Zn-dependent oxidoreductase